MLKVVPCNIVFMKDRVLLAHLTPALQKAENNRLSQENKAKGLGFFKESAAMMRFWADYCKKYYTMTECEILAEAPANTSIHYSTISEFYFKCYSEIIGDSETPNSSYGGTLHIKTSGGDKIKFTHRIENSKTVKETLTKLLGSKLIYKK